MNKLHVITPVKDSLETTLRTIESVLNSKSAVSFDYTIYNDFSSDETTERLEKESLDNGFKLINLKDFTIHPSPNYLLILQMAQAEALRENAHLIIIESDVVVMPDTIETLYNQSVELQHAGLIASITHDGEGIVNFPYLYAKNYELKRIDTKKRISFCCTLITIKFLNSYDFKELNPEKSWYDIFISRQSLQLGFSNYLLMETPVLHNPHSSRPWKKLKYTNPLRYYFSKFFIKNNDKF